MVDAVGQSDVFVVKYDKDGNHIWSKGFGNLSFDEGTAIEFDSAGNILLTGNFIGSINFGGRHLLGVADTDIFLVKLDPSGNHIWSKAFSGAFHNFGESLAVDASDNVVACGLIRDFANFAGVLLRGPGISSAYLVKYDSDGNHLWSQALGGSIGEIGRGVSIDSQNNIVMTGAYNSIDADFGGGPLSSSGKSDVFLAKFDSGGNHLWSRGFGATEHDQGRAVGVDRSDDDIFITGEMSGSVDFGGGALAFSGFNDFFVAGFDRMGNHIWSKSAGGTEDDRGWGIDVTDIGDIVVTGEFQETIDFGGGESTTESTGMFLVKLSGTPSDPPPQQIINTSVSNLFQSTDEGTNAGSQSFTVMNSGAATLLYSITDDADWLSVSPTTGTSSGVVNTHIVTYAASLLPAGTHQATIGVVSSQASNSPQTIDVTLTIIGDPMISVNPASLSPVAPEGGNAASDSFTVTNLGGRTMEYSITDNVDWLSVSPASGTSTGETNTHTVVYSASLLATGTHTADIMIFDPGASNNPQTLAVTLTVLQRPVFSVSPSSLTQTIFEGENAPALSFHVTNLGESALNYSITDDAAWLSVIPATGLSTGGANTHTLSFSTSTLASGTYTAEIRLSDPIATNSPQSIVVSLTVNRSREIFLAPRVLSQTIRPGQNATSQSFTLRNNGPGVLNYLITEDADWLFVSPSFGVSTGETDFIAVNYSTAALSAGIYLATISVSDPAAANNPQTVAVTLIVNGAAVSSSSSGSSGGGCFIATATYGTPMADEIGALRAVRDAYLLDSALGTAFVDVYYRVSPPIADAVSQSPVLRGAVRVVLTPVVALSKGVLAAPGLTLGGVFLLAVFLAVWMYARVSSKRATLKV